MLPLEILMIVVDDSLLELFIYDLSCCFSHSWRSSTDAITVAFNAMLMVIWLQQTLLMISQVGVFQR